MPLRLAAVGKVSACLALFLKARGLPRQRFSIDAELHVHAGALARFSRYVAADEPAGRRWTLATITEDTIETFFATLGSLAVHTRNSYVQVLKASFRWAARKSYIAKSPISDDSTLKRSKGAQRRRRVMPAEEKALLAASGMRLQWLIIAAIESGCRAGELLALQWGDVSFEKRTLLVRAVEEGAMKTEQSRLLPTSQRLHGILEMAKTNPTGKDYAADKYVFGELGEQRAFPKKAWNTAVLKAHKHAPEWLSGGLAPASRAVLDTIDLHFHDLRHEAGCRWLEAGWPIDHVQEMLGDANLVANLDLLARARARATRVDEQV